MLFLQWNVNELPLFLKPPYQSRLLPDHTVHEILQVLKPIEKKAPNQHRGKTKFLGMDERNSRGLGTDTVKALGLG